jgi:hypothetical protein
VRQVIHHHIDYHQLIYVERDSLNVKLGHRRVGPTQHLPGICHSLNTDGSIEASTKIRNREGYSERCST